MVDRCDRFVSCVILAAMLAAGGCGSDLAGPNVTGAVVETHPGKKIYNQYCFSCHTPGLSGAPKLGDADAWGPRIEQGQAQLLATTIAGVAPAMPPRGLCPTCSDDQLAQAIDYMVRMSK